MYMKRVISFSLNQANQIKIDLIKNIFNESIRVLQQYVDHYWDKQEYSKKYPDIKFDSFLSAALLQVLGRQALDTMRSLKRKKKKSKPVIKNLTIVFDKRFQPDLRKSNKHFDFWFRLVSLKSKKAGITDLKLPIKSHKLYKKYLSKGWVQKNSFRLRRFNDQYFLDFIFEKEAPKIKATGKNVGVDLGFNNLIVTSDKTFYGKNLKDIYIKASKKERGSENKKQVLRYRDCEINRSVNSMPWGTINTVCIEALKDIKKNSRKKGKIHHKLMNHMQYWSYRKTIDKIKRISEEKGIKVVEVPPFYTSQTCPACGHIHKDNRLGEKFLCIRCGYADHADVVGAVNILQRGETLMSRYLPSPLKVSSPSYSSLSEKIIQIGAEVSGYLHPISTGTVSGGAGHIRTVHSDSGTACRRCR